VRLVVEGSEASAWRSGSREVEAFTIEANKQSITVKASTWTTVPVVRAVAGAHARTLCWTCPGCTY
jgi:hypothetical protein